MIKIGRNTIRLTIEALECLKGLKYSIIVEIVVTQNKTSNVPPRMYVRIFEDFCFLSNVSLLNSFNF